MKNRKIVTYLAVEHIFSHLDLVLYRKNKIIETIWHNNQILKLVKRLLYRIVFVEATKYVSNVSLHDIP